jgi:hypothetical protein
VTMAEQHAPPVYACAAGAVLHAHADSTLEPAVVLHTFLPAGVRDRLDAPGVRVDVSSDGSAASTLTVRVLADDQALTWSLPLAPFVAALPGQSGDDGRMVLLAVVDGEPGSGFWAQPVDCEDLAAELQLPVADLAEALRGRLTPWLAEDLELLLHDDAHDRALDTSPAQAVADAVLAAYRGDLDAGQVAERLVQALLFAPEGRQLEIGVRLCAALATAVRTAGPGAVAAVLASTGRFEAEEQRLLQALPARLAAPQQAAEQLSDAELTMDLVADAEDRDEAVRAAVRVTARLAREAFGAELDGTQVLQRLEMVDDEGVLRLARLWVDLAVGTVPPAALGERVRAEGRPGLAWLRATGNALGDLALEVAGRRTDRVEPAVRAARDPAAAEADLVVACRELAGFVRQRGRVGPATWLLLPAGAAAAAVGAAVLDGTDREACVDLLVALLEQDVEPQDLLDGLVCATAQLLVGLDPQQDETVRRLQVAELLDRVAGRGPQGLLLDLLRLAPGHDAMAVDLGAVLPPGGPADADRTAVRLGLHGLMRDGLTSLEAMGAVLGEEADMPVADVLGDALPSALVEHGLLVGAEQ